MENQKTPQSENRRKRLERQRRLRIKRRRRRIIIVCCEIIMMLVLAIACYAVNILNMIQRQDFDNIQTADFDNTQAVTVIQNVTDEAGESETVETVDSQCHDNGRYRTGTHSVRILCLGRTQPADAHH